MKTQRNPITLVDLIFSFYTIIWWLEIGKRNEFLGKIRIEFLVGLILVVIAGMRISRGDIKFFNPVNKAILTYLLVAFSSVLLSVNIAHSWEIYFNNILKLSVMGFFIQVFIRKTFQLKLFLMSSFIAFFKIGMEALHGKITGSMVWQSQGVMRLNGPQGSMFGHPNSLSGKYLGLFPFLWYLFPALSKKWKTAFIIAFIFMINILIFTGSRTGYLSFISAILFILYRSTKKIKLLVVGIALIVVAVLFVPQEYQERFASSFTGQEKEGHSSETRKILFHDSLLVFRENPLGVGIGGFIEVQRRNGRNPQDTHNLYTQILSETGIQGFLVFGLLIVTILRSIRSSKIKLKFLTGDIYGYIKSPTISDSACSQLGLSLHQEAVFLLKITISIELFLFIRLILGIFGHDLYEIYWWVGAGTAMGIETCCTDLVRNFQKYKAATVPS